MARQCTELGGCRSYGVEFDVFKSLKLTLPFRDDRASPASATARSSLSNPVNASPFTLQHLHSAEGCPRRGAVVLFPTDPALVSFPAFRYGRFLCSLSLFPPAPSLYIGDPAFLVIPSSTISLRRRHSLERPHSTSTFHP
jgi:hypothetical protein